MQFYTISNYSATPPTNNTAIQQNTFVDGKRGTAILLLSRRKREARNCLSVFRPLTKDQSRRHWMKCHVTHPLPPTTQNPAHAGGTSSARQSQPSQSCAGITMWKIEMGCQLGRKLINEQDLHDKSPEVCIAMFWGDAARILPPNWNWIFFIQRIFVCGEMRHPASNSIRQIYWNGNSIWRFISDDFVIYIQFRVNHRKILNLKLEIEQSRRIITSVVKHYINKLHYISW